METRNLLGGMPSPHMRRESKHAMHYRKLLNVQWPRPMEHEAKPTEEAFFLSALPYLPTALGH
jgi:hypothetical protein